MANTLCIIFSSGLYDVYSLQNYLPGRHRNNVMVRRCVILSTMALILDWTRGDTPSRSSDLLFQDLAAATGSRLLQSATNISSSQIARQTCPSFQR